MKRKLFCLIFILACLATFCFGVAAEGNTLRGGSEVVAVPGKTVLFPVYMESTGQIASCKIYVTCDTSVFSAEAQSVGYRVEKGEVTKSGNIFANTYGNVGWQINWVHTRNVTANGVFCYLPLQVAEDAELGTYTVEVSYSAPNTCDQDGKDVTFTCQKGTIKVVSAEPTLYTDTVRGASGMVWDIPVCIRNNPGMTSILFTFREWSPYIKFIKDSEGKPIMTIAEPYENGTFEYYEYLPGRWRFLWYSTDAVTVDGPVLTLRVQVNGTDGTSGVGFQLDYDPDNTLTYNNEKVVFEDKMGAIWMDYPPVRSASVENNVMSVQMADNLTSDVVVYATVSAPNGKQKAIYSIDPTKTNNQISIEKENTDTVSIYAMTANGMVPVMEPVVIN